MLYKYLDYNVTNPIFGLGSTWRAMQVAQPPLKALIVLPFPGNPACLFAEHYGGEMFWDVCYDGVLVKYPSGVTFRNLFRTLKMILKRHKEMLKEHREDGLLVEHLEDFDEDIDSLQFNLLIKAGEAVCASSVAL